MVKLKQNIKNFIKLINYERKAEINAMQNEIKKLSGHEREEKGRAINNLKGKPIGKELGFQIVKYGRKKEINTEINIGDLVLISAGNPLKSDLTGTVTEKGSRFIKVAFESIPKWALKKHVRLDLYVNDVTFRRMEDNLNSLTLYGENALNLLLSKINSNPIEDYDEKVDFNDKGLNKSQKIAIEKSLKSKDFYLIHGPFGTGKTRTLIELIYQEYIRGNKILATSESNTSADNILERLSKFDIEITRLGHPQRVLKDNIKYTLAYKFENHPLNQKIESIHKKISKICEERDKHTKPSPRYRRGYSDSEIYRLGVQRRGGRGVSSEMMNSMAKWLEQNSKVNKLYLEIDRYENSIIKDIITNSDVIISTNSSAALEEISNIRFDVAIIDEATQATIPSVLIPINKSKKFILAGDHKQLPPTIISEKASELSETLFEKLIEKYEEKSSLLKVQYRMNDKLIKFPNEEFYNGELTSDNSVKNISLSDILNLEDVKNLNKKEKKLLSSKHPLIFIDTSEMENNFEKHLKDSKSIVNKLESKIVLKISKFYENLGINFKDIGIITPYLDQANLISNKTDVEVKTVDGFQGREKEIIIISTVRSNKKGKIGFLKDLRRLNVSLTRAKRKLIIVGNKKTLSHNKHYAKLINESLEI